MESETTERLMMVVSVFDWRANYLSDLVESPACALDLKLGPDLKLGLLLLHVHQVPLVLQSCLTPFPELQKQSN